MKQEKATLQMKPNGRGFAFKTRNGYTLSVAVGAGSYSDNQNVAMDTLADPATTTMEVAIMTEEGNFTVLPYDVAGFVPVVVLGDLIEAIEGRDWERVLLLVGETEEPDYSKFPL